MSFTARNASAIVVLSKFHFQKIQESGLRFQQLEIIPSGIDTTQFQFSEKSLKPPYQLLSIANLNLVKDQKTLLNAFKIICDKVDAHLTIIGRDTLNSEIQQWAEARNVADKVTFLPRVSHQLLPSFFEKASVFLLSSLSETQAAVVNEAMASGLVVVGTRVGLIADLEDECTLAIDVKDAENLAKKVINLLENPQKFTELQANGLAWAREHDLDWTVGKYQELFEEITQKFI